MSTVFLVVALFSHAPLPPLTVLQTAGMADCRAAVAQQRGFEHGRVIWAQCVEVRR